jgi:GAF domain-containing protein
VAPEVLLVPLYLGGDDPLGTLWVVSETGGHFTRDHARLLTELAKSVGAAVNAWNHSRLNPTPLH